MSLSLGDVLLLSSLGGMLAIMILKVRRLIHFEIVDFADIYTEAIISAFLWLLCFVAMLSEISVLTVTLFKITTFLFIIVMMFFVLEHMLFMQKSKKR